uniref:Uncharacterized protein n=1 Tax=Lepisosteus oculatus TaxID=7918 RepID=W5NNF6_LEPOC
KMAFKKWLQFHNDMDYQHYKTLRSAAKQAVAVAKTMHCDWLYEELNTPEGANKIYHLASAHHCSTQDIDQVTHVKNDDHQVLQDLPAILRRWSDYFSRICNKEFPHPPIQSANPILGPILPVTTAKIEATIKMMRNGKATGPNDNPAEVWKIFGHQGANILVSLFDRITDQGAVPPIWPTSTMVP